MRGQSWRSKKISARAPDSRPMYPGPAVLADTFFDLQLWPLISLQPLDQNQCLVPHMKDLLNICLEIKDQGFWMTFKVCNLGSKQPYFNRGYVVRGWIFNFGTVQTCVWMSMVIVMMIAVMIYITVFKNHKWLQKWKFVRDTVSKICS